MGKRTQLLNESADTTAQWVSGHSCSMGKRTQLLNESASKPRLKESSDTALRKLEARKILLINCTQRKES